MTQLRGDQIRDGTITDADVAANAAISASKLDSSLATQTYVNTQIASAGVSVPTGTIMMWPTGTAPTGWKLCDGGTVDRGSALGQVIGTTYGIGNGSTTCNVPNLCGRIPVGAGTGAQNGGSGSGAISGGTALTARSLGAWAGKETHALTAAESGIPAHDHGGWSGGQNYSHSHSVVGSATVYLAAGGLGFGVASGSVNTSAASNDHSHSIPTHGPVNAANAHNNMQPFLVLNYIIKT